MGIGITHLGSGSRGNATIVSSGDCNVLVDCGFSLKQTEKRLGIAGFEPSSIDSIVVTHHHKDHSCSALRASKKWDSRLHCNLGTASKMGWDLVEECMTFGNLERVQFSSELSMLPVPVPHDDADNVALIASDRNGGRAAIVTDLGEAPQDLIKHLSGCNHISIESNYDHQRLVGGPYPDSLKRRISGRGGHLSNRQAGEILLEVLHDDLESIVLCHLSEKNNAPHLAESEVLMAIGDEFAGNISISKQLGPEFSYWTGQSEPNSIVAA
ncbi:MAG: MBL fold metallo-hydrolase [Candidatus Thalassarchaeaceae archaeon]|nr:MBL fold metallo-hydrolase [Candidatus Thalassarchaeaceae archaeon]